MTKNKISKNISILLFLILFCNSSVLLISLNAVNNKTEFSAQRQESLKSSANDNLNLLHSYDFEDDVVGQDPTGITLSVNDPIDSGSVSIDNLGDVQQNHVALHKSGGSKSIRLTDNASYYGDTYDAGELHFKFYHDNSLFGIHFRDSTLPGLNGLMFAIDLWNGIVGRHGVTSYASYNLNEWTELIVYYNISLGWMFDINGVRFGDEYSFSFERENPSGLEYINWGSAYSGGGNGYLRLDDIAFYYYGDSVTVSKLWSYETGDDVYSSPALGDVDGDGKLEVVIGSEDKSVYALNGEDGSFLWSYETLAWVWSSPALGDIDGDGKLEVVIGSGKVYALNGEDGSFLWSYSTGGWTVVSPALGDVDGDGKLEVVVGSDDGKVYALNGEDGSFLWSYSTGGWWGCSPALGDIDGDGKLEVVVGSNNRKVHALNGEDGSLIWSYNTVGTVPSYPALGDVDGDGKLEVVVGGYGSKIFTLNGEDGSLAWSIEKDRELFESNPALGDVDGDGKLEVVIGGNNNRRDEYEVFALNGEDGSFAWASKLGFFIIGSSSAIGDVDGDERPEVVIGCNDGKISALNGENGDLIWNFETGYIVQSSPALGDIDGDGKLEVVVGSGDGKVYALNPTPSGEKIQWQGHAGENFLRQKALPYLLDYRPDFASSQHDIIISEGDDGNTYFHTKITNLGLTYDSDITVRFYDEFDGSSTQIGADQIITGLSRNETKTSSVEWIPALFHTIRIIIDPDNSIEEVREDNNEYYYEHSISKPPIVDDNNGIINLKLLGDGVFSSGTDSNSLIEQFDETKVMQIPNYDYNDADINVLPQYYGKDTLISGPLTISGTSYDLPLDWANHQYISNIEASVSSAEYTTKRGGHIKHALTWRGTGISGISYSQVYDYNVDIPKFQDNDVTTSGSNKVYNSVNVPLQYVWTYVQSAVEIGTEILDYKWDWNWELQTIELWWTLYSIIGQFLDDSVATNLLGTNRFKIEIMAKDELGEVYSIPLVHKYLDDPIQCIIIPGYIGVADTHTYNYHLKVVLNDINLRDVKRYSETNEQQWYGSHGNPVITIRFYAASGSSWKGDLVRTNLDIREFSTKFTFKSDANDERKLTDPSDFYISAPFQENLIYINNQNTLGWTNRAPINSTNSHLRLGIDFYNTYENIIINFDYIKVRYYKFSPTTKCQLKINDNHISRQLNSWIYEINEFDQSSLYNALGSFASVDLSPLSLTYEPWDSGWEYNDSIVFAYQIDLAIVLEVDIPYYDTHGEYLYDLGFWQRDITINWKQIQLEGVYIEELYINDLLQSPWRIFLDYHKENIEIWKTSQQISYTWPEGSSYEVITLEFDTIEYNTLFGTDIEVLDEDTGVNITFSEVTGTGMTTIEKSEEEPDPPTGFELAGEYYDVTTDATFSGVISIAIPYNESKVIGNEENLKIWHWEPLTGWTDVTTGVDTVNNIIYGEFTTFSTFIVLEKVEHEYILREIDQLIEKIDNSPDTCWRKNSNKNTMINKLIELKSLVSGDDLGEAYDKLLHDIKPKLTGLKTDENEEDWGNGVLKNLWVTCEDLQDEFCLDCNVMLEHLSVLFLSPSLESSVVYDSNQLIYIGCSLIGLLGIIFFNQTWRKKKLI